MAFLLVGRVAELDARHHTVEVPLQELSAITDEDAPVWTITRDISVIETGVWILRRALEQGDTTMRNAQEPVYSASVGAQKRTAYDLAGCAN